VPPRSHAIAKPGLVQPEQALHTPASSVAQSIVSLVKETKAEDPTSNEPIAERLEPVLWEEEKRLKAKVHQ